MQWSQILPWQIKAQTQGMQKNFPLNHNRGEDGLLKSLKEALLIQTICKEAAGSPFEIEKLQQQQMAQYKWVQEHSTVNRAVKELLIMHFMKP